MPDSLRLNCGRACHRITLIAFSILPNLEIAPADKLLVGRFDGPLVVRLADGIFGQGTFLAAPGGRHVLLRAREAEEEGCETPHEWLQGGQTCAYEGNVQFEDAGNREKGVVRVGLGGRKEILDYLINLT